MHGANMQIVKSVDRTRENDESIRKATNSLLRSAGF
jgi:hypothetical protein